MITEASNAEVHQNLTTIRNILVRFDDEGREGMLATIVLWWAAHEKDRVAAITRLFERVADLEEEIAREELQ